MLHTSNHCSAAVCEIPSAKLEVTGDLEAGPVSRQWGVVMTCNNLQYYLTGFGKSMESRAKEGIVSLRRIISLSDAKFKGVAVEVWNIVIAMNGEADLQLVPIWLHVAPRESCRFQDRGWPHEECDFEARVGKPWLLHSCGDVFTWSPFDNTARSHRVKIPVLDICDF